MFRIEAKVDDGRFRMELWRNAEKWPKAVESTIKAMKTRAPRIVAETASKVYNIPKARINPNNKRVNGTVSISGGLTDLTLTYTGTPMPSNRFAGGAIKPKRASNTRPYKVTAEYMRGKRTVIGHWQKPFSEGGRYGMKSPRMFIPGVGAYGPVQRVGRGWSGGTFGPSVPQMVMNRGNGEEEIERISEVLDERLAYFLGRAGL